MKKFLVTFSVRDRLNPDNFVIATYDPEFNLIDGSIMEEFRPSGIAGCCVLSEGGKRVIYCASENKIAMLDEDYNLLKLLNIGEDNHDLKYDEQSDCLFLVSSFEGSVIKLDRNLFVQGRFFHNHDIDDEDERKSHYWKDGNLHELHAPIDFHLNSCDIKGDNILMTIHNRDREGYITEFNMKTPEERIVHRGLNQPHDAVYYKRGILVNSSKDSLLVHTTTPIEKSWDSLLVNYTRGLLVDNVDNVAYVGTSTNNSRTHHDTFANHIDNVVFKVDLDDGMRLSQYSLNVNTGAEIFGIYYY